MWLEGTFSGVKLEEECRIYFTRVYDVVKCGDDMVGGGF